MGTIMTIKDADFSAFAPLSDIPVLGSLEYWNYFGGDATQSTKNYAEGKPALGLSGNPAYVKNYALVKNDIGWFTTNFSETANITLMAVRRAGDTNSSGTTFISNFVSTTTAANVGTSIDMDASGLFGSTYYSADGSTYQSQSVRDPSATNADADVAKLTNWFFSAVRVDTAKIVLNDKTNADYVATANIPGGSTRVLGTTKYNIGARGSGGRSNLGHLAFAAIYSRTLSDDELNVVYARLKKVMNRRGIAI